MGTWKILPRVDGERAGWGFMRSPQGWKPQDLSSTLSPGLLPGRDASVHYSVTALCSSLCPTMPLAIQLPLCQISEC